MDLFRFPFDAYLAAEAEDAGAEGAAGLSLEPWLSRSAERWGSTHPFLPDFLDGVLLIPLLLALSRSGRWTIATDGGTARLRLDLEGRARAEVEALVLDKGWATRAGDGLALTRTGRFVVERIPITAALASYRPMFLRAEELLFGDAARVFALDEDGDETHLDRALNVLGSGFQHDRYFVALSELVVELFDHEDFESQPRYIADTGCGDGSLLRRLVETVRDRTRRGRVLDRYPLVAVAIDYNEKALEVAARTLEGLDFIAIQGDIGAPDGILRELEARGVDDLDRVLHVRSFLDHDRPYREPEDREAAAGRAGRRLSGVYIDRDGRAIPPEDMVQSTVEHLRRWAGAINDHGLVLLEVHCLAPATTGRFLDESESFHFDAYQALSHQYPVEPEVFLACAAEAGLFRRAGRGRRFPEHLPFTRITLSHFERRPYTVRQARRDDLPELAGLEEVWPQVAARWERGVATAELEGRLRDAPEGLFILRDDDGALVAAVATERRGARGAERTEAGPVQVTAVRVRPSSSRGPDAADEPPGDALSRDRARDLLDVVETYWSLADPAVRFLGLGDARRALGPDPARGAGSAESAAADGARSAWSIARAVGARARATPFDPDDDPRAGEREIGELSFRWLVAIFQGMGVLREPGETYELDALERRLGVAPKYHRYFDALTRRLAAEGALVREGDRITAGPSIREYALGSVDEEVAAFERALPRRHPSCAGLMKFTLRCLSRYADVLTGATDVADVLFQDGDMETFGEVFHGDAVSDHFNRIVADAVREVVDRAPDGEPVRVLEIGGGTGGTTVAVLEALGPVADRVEYCFTDVSQAFLRHARRRFAEGWPRMELRTLDIDSDPAAQGFAGRRFDAIVAANVLHDTRDIERTLARTGSLLAPDGLLVLNEYTSVKDCLSFSGALLHGWWLFEDPERRLPDSCLLSVPLWQQALERTGFALAGAFTLPTQSASSPECSQSVMLCRGLAERPVEAPAAEATPAEARASVPRTAPVAPEPGPGPPIERIAHAVRHDLLMILGEDRADAYAPDRPLMEMGLDSIELVELKYHLGRRFDLELSSTFLFEHETPEKITAALKPMVPEERLRPADAREGTTGPVSPDGREAPGVPGTRDADAGAVAVVGVACRFPGGVTTPEELWRLLERGEDGIRRLPEGRWRWPEAVDVAGTHRGIDLGGFLERIDEFDARFFRVSPKEAELMDPQQRMLLELSWQALEDAGHRPSELSGRAVGVFVGVCHGDYRDVLRAASETADAYVGSGSAYSILANRLSYFYDFKGPSLSVDTACSSSLVALHEAIAALRLGDCEQALVGAANLLCSPTNSLTYHDAGMLSPRGRCGAFDARADGYVRGEGGAVLVLKPLARAREDGDSVYGVIRGSAVNHGGQAASLTAPKPDAQAAVIEAAWRRAGAPPDAVGLIEAHGTGTRLGDPIETRGLTEAFRSLYRDAGLRRPAAPTCAVGTIKSNLGHLEGAAGLAGLIKVLLALGHGRIPRTLHFDHLNPEIVLEGTPFQVAARTTDWPVFRDARGRELPRLAGVSAFGFGGANAHVVVEAAPDLAPPGASPDADAPGPFLVPLSARSEDRLLERARLLLELLERRHPGAAAATSGPSSEGARPAGPTGADPRGALAEILRRSFDLEPDGGAGPDWDLEWEELGWGAAETQLFLAAVEEDLGVRLPTRALVESPSLASLALRLEGAGDGVRAAPARSAGKAAPAPGLRDLAFTLQVGREPMGERLAFVVEDLPELIAGLRSVLAGTAGESGARGIHRGYVTAAGRQADTEAASVEELLARRDLPALAARWVLGAEVDWRRLDPAGGARRVHLPTYPFERERFWARGAETSEAPRERTAGSGAGSLLGPGEGEALAWRFGVSLSGAEPFLADHVIDGRRVLPAVAYLEMVRAAVRRATGGAEGPVWLRGVTWLRPFVAGAGPGRLDVRLTRDGEGELEVEVSGASDGAGGEPVLHAQGRAGVGVGPRSDRAPGAAEAGAIDLDALRARCTEARQPSERVYDALEALGYHYGPTHRGIRELPAGRRRDPRRAGPSGRAGGHPG